MSVINYAVVKSWTQRIFAALDAAIVSSAGITTSGTVTAEQLTSTDDITAADAITATAGNITASAGNIAATLGSVAAGTTVTAGTTMTAGTGLTVTTGNLAVTAGGITAGTTIVATGDMNAGGGFRRSIQFTAPGAAGVTAADQTALAMRADLGVTGYAHSYVAPRAGSITGLSAQLSTAITTAGAPMVLDVIVTIDGTPVAAATVGFTTAGAEVVDFLSITKDTSLHTFAAGAVIGCVYTSTTIDNTPSLVAWVEVEH